jgi:hypothetical protein
MKRYQEQKDLHMIFINLEKAYDKISRNIYVNVVNFIKACDDESSVFSIKIDLYQESSLSSYFHLSVRWDHKGYIKRHSSVHDDVVLIDDNMIGVN